MYLWAKERLSGIFLGIVIIFLIIYIHSEYLNYVEFKEKFSIETLEKFFGQFPEEKRGRKNFKKKEIQNVRALIYERIFQKGFKIKADCIGSIKEVVDKELIIIKVSFFIKNG